MNKTLEERIQEAIDRVAKYRSINKSDKPMITVSKVISTLIEDKTSTYDGKKILNLAADVLDKIEIG